MPDQLQVSASVAEPRHTTATPDATTGTADTPPARRGCCCVRFLDEDGAYRIQVLACCPRHGTFPESDDEHD